MQCPLKTHLLALLVSTPLLFCSAEDFDVYFGTANDGGIHHAAFRNSEGTFGPIRKVAALNGAGFIAIHPTQPYLYSVAKRGKRNEPGHVVAFKINENQSLTELN